MGKRSKHLLSQRKIELYNKNAEIIKFFRRNPIIACEMLLGIPLLDAQKLILQEAWNKPYVVMCCSRNFGKSFLGSILMMLKFLLFENQQIYIISSVGSQSQETFQKIEKIAQQRIDSVRSLKDIFKFELVTSPANTTGFTHNPASFHCMAYNGSEIFTLNGKPDNNRSKRATMVFFDEAGFSSDEIVLVSEAFATQNSNFAMSTDENFSLDAQYKKCPTQLIYASSASDVSTIFYKRYKEFAKKMFMGDSRFYVADIPCDIPLNPTVKGKAYKPLLKQEQVDNAMSSNREKALREYYNRFTTDGGESQAIKRAMIIRNANLYLPEMCNKNNSDKFIMAIDPARNVDNSVCSIMKLKYDKEIGYYGEIVNCVSFFDIGKKKKTPMLTPNQIEYFKNLLLGYNGKAPDYENIDMVLIDSGAGGGGYSAWADNLLLDWTDNKGKTHKGMIDDTDDVYKEYINKYPNASNKLKMISPKKYKTQMVGELKELLELDLIKFTQEYNEKGYVTLAEDTIIKDKDSGKEKNKERKIKEYKLSLEESVAMVNIDIMKTETVSIHGSKSSNGSITYALPKELEGKMHDDRFYTLCLLAHRLYELRRDEQVNRYNEDEVDATDYFFIN